MKVLTILGTRPEIIRLSRVIPRLDQALGRENHILINTGQNYDPNLNANFFEELDLREPDYDFGATGSLGQQLATLFPAVEHTIQSVRPDRLLILGDTNSSLAAIIAARMGIPVYHMEAGNRCYSPHSPEEVNRRLIDHASTVLLPYTERSRQNLLAEGIHSSRIFVTGNPIREVLEYYRKEIAVSDIHVRLKLKTKSYFLVTLHRAENVDDYGRLGSFLRAFDQLQRKYDFPVVVSAHPHAKKRIQTLARTSAPSLLSNPQVTYRAPFSFFDFQALASEACCVLTDSGTVQEECCLSNVPSVIMRNYTERPETLEAGASILAEADEKSVMGAVRLATKQLPMWVVPPEYIRSNVSETVVRILTSHFERNCQ